MNIAPPPPPELTRKNDIWAVELPHGMPKDSHLLPTHSQDLLRAARSGRLYKRPTPAEEEEAEIDPAVAEKPDKKEEDASTKGFQIKVWKQVPRNAEGPTVSHLAKRRKGTITLSSSLPAGAAPGPTVTKATVRRIDAAGNPYTQEVTLTEGQAVDGEIISTTVVALPNPSTNGDASASATPVRKRPPPPKRKPKGPGRGRRKKLPLPANPNPNAAYLATVAPVQGVQAVQVSICSSMLKINPLLMSIQGSKLNDDASKNQDTEMADDDDGDEGEDGEEDGEEGDDDDDDGEGPEGDTVPASRADSEAKSDQMEITPSLTPTDDAIKTVDQSAQDTPAPAHTHLSAPPPPSSHIEGSPLKNVVFAQSPSSVDHNSPVRESAPLPPSTLSSAELALPPAEVPASIPPPTDATIVNEPFVEITLPTIEEPKPEYDLEMSDVPPTQVDSSSASTGAPPPLFTEPMEPAVIAAAVSSTSVEEAENKATGTETSVENTEAEEPGGTAPGDIPPASEIIKQESFPAEPPAQNPTDVVTDNFGTDVKVVDDAPAAEGADSSAPAPASAPGPAESQSDQPPVQPSQEEYSANSPDLFSGLEAALDQQGPTPAAPPNSTTTASGPPGS